MKPIISAFYYLFFVISGIPLITIAFCIWLLTVAFDKKLSLLHWFTLFWARFLYFVIPSWRLTVKGKEKIDNKKPVVYISNHQSDFDIVVVSHLFAYFKWVSKSEVFKVPIVGWNMSLNRYISLKRGSRKSIMEMVNNCCTSLQKGEAVFLFPEGTRSVDGRLGRFSSGAFSIAQKAKADIQPIVLNGTKDIMNKGSWMLNFTAKVELKVLDRVPYSEIEKLSTNEISNKLRSLILEELEEMQAREKRS